MLLLASFWPLRHAQLLEIYLHLFTNALEGEQYVAMKQAFAQERNEREQNFRTLKSTVDQTEESVNSLRQELVSMREDVQKLAEEKEAQEKSQGVLGSQSQPS